jgi:hypothetical protein
MAKVFCFSGAIPAIHYIFACLKSSQRMPFLSGLGLLFSKANPAHFLIHLAISDMNLKVFYKC